MKKRKIAGFRYRTFALLFIIFLTTQFLLFLTSQFLNRAPKSTTLLRNDFQVFCNGNDAVILASSGFVSTGKIYYLVKEDDKWSIAQILDLAPYLKSRHTVQNLNVEWGRRNRSLQYNDRWLVVGLNRYPASKNDKNWRDYSGSALIFKKENGRWVFHYDVTKVAPFINMEEMTLTSDDLFFLQRHSYSSRFKHKGIGQVRRLDLKTPEPIWREDLCPYDDSVTEYIMVKRVFESGDWLAVCKNNKHISLYRRDRNDWKLTESFPSHGDLFQFTNTFTENEIVFSYYDLHATRETYPKIYRYKFADDRWTLVQEEKEYNIDYPRNKDSHFCRQEPSRYSLCWQGKGEQFGIAKPSPDDAIHYVDPDWIVEDPDPETFRVVSDYYKYDFNFKYAPTIDIEYLKSLGCNNFYDYVDYVPTLNYALSGNTLVTSYMFLDCHFAGCPMQKAKVWAGVNVYEIDPTTGPKRMLALTTRNIEDLKPVPVSEEEVSKEEGKD